MLCISQVGTSVEAMLFIDALSNEKEIEDDLLYGWAFGEQVQGIGG